MANKKVIVYIDGFNFYFGLKSAKWKRYYWLDTVKFFSKFLKSYQDLVQVNYFSAIPHDNGKQDRQDLFFSANKLNPRFQLHLGKFLKKEIKCFNCRNSHFSFEEKESDVRIATTMIADVVSEKCDISILVSADSDLIPPIDFIRSFKPSHKIFVYFPPRRNSTDLRNKCDQHIFLERHQSKFEECMFDDEVPLLSNGYVLKRPTNWY